MLRAEDPVPVRRDTGLIALLGVCLVLGVIYNFVIALGYGPDEPRHMNYVKLLLDEHIFPYIMANGKEYKGAHSLHPPLYYSFLVPFYALTRPLLGDNAWHVLRVLSSLIGVGSLFLLYQVALRFGSRRLALLATAQVGLLPMWGMIAGVVNNDSSSLFAQSFLLWLLAVRFSHDRTMRAAAIIGVVLGLGALCKATNIICGGTSFVVFLLLQAGGLRATLRDANSWGRLGAALLIAIVICGPWYARSFLLYGQLTPIEAGYVYPTLKAAATYGPLTVMMHSAFLPLSGIALWHIFCSMWSQKDWIPETLRSPTYAAFVIYSTIAVLGNVRSRFAPRRADKVSVEVVEAPQNSDSVELPARIALVCGLSAFIVNVGVCAAIAVFKHWGWAEGGRYLLPSIGGASLWAACGWRALVGEKGLRFVLTGWCAALIALNAVALYWLVTFLNPTYVK